ncbi:YdgA family protein [Salinimonas sp. HHU 13199]|uniref:YdgA family protein n=1 Tax=Salinimonas profundi TaxID=2729140 RepID=A0ABR8LDV0_9ALTE|nr:DUF945 family protein [Salinimonas profundi]MBD3584462.1 YdgA family protein [Salinimonas profundi]
MGKKLVLIVGGLAVLAVGGQILTKSRYSAVMESQFDALKSAYQLQGIELSREISEENFVGAKDIVTITLTQDYLAQYGLTDSSSLSVQIDNDCRFFPFYVMCDSDLSSPSDDLPSLGEFSPVMDYSVNILFDSISGNLSLDEAVIEENDGTLTVHPLTLSYDTDLAFDEVNASLNWQGTTLKGSSSGTDITLGTVDATAESSRVFGNVYASEATFTIANIDISSATYGSSVKINNARFTTEFEEETSETFELEYRVAIDDVNAEAQQMMISDFVLDISLDNISRKTMAYLNAEDTEDSTEQVTQMLAEFGKSKHSIDIEAFDFKLSDVPVNSAGSLMLSPYDESDLQSGVFSDKLAGAIDISIGKAVTQAFPASKPVIQQYLDQGLLSEDDDRYKVNVSLDNGNILANGVPVYQM